MKRRFWSAQDLELLRKLYPATPTRDVARRLNRSTSAIYRQAAILRLTKTAAFLDSPASGRLRKGESRPGSEGTRFQRGLTPWNKGLRRPGWHRGRMRETQFKRGQRLGKAAQNWVPIGTVKKDSYGYLRIKLREATHGEPYGFGNREVWPQLHRHVWETEHGPVPPSHIVVFRDGNRENCALENLALMSRGENCRRNSMWAVLPRELAEAMQLNGALKRKLRKLRSVDGKK